MVRVQAVAAESWAGPKAAHYRERHVAPQRTVITAKTALSRAQPVC